MSSVKTATPVWSRLNLPAETVELLTACPSVTVANTVDELVDLACGGPGSMEFEVAYDVPGRGRVVEAHVVRVRNGVSANYTEPYMRRRDPDCMVIADDQPTDKELYQQRYGKPFAPLRQETFDWLRTQDLALFAFAAGEERFGLDAVAIVPANAGFFALGLAMLQGIRPLDSIGEGFSPKLIIYTAPPFRHTHFEGRQIVVHSRIDARHEMFAYNLYPGPSAKKGVYGTLLHVGEREGWVTAHCSTVEVITPYDNVLTIMHEGASGGGKSEMLEPAHRENDGRLKLGTNVVTGETRYLEIPRSCSLRPVTDDMALCHPTIQDDASGKLRLADAENAWFVRVNHIEQYATDPDLEGLTAQPPEPLLFLNIDAVAGSRALIWEHTMDAPGEPCPNPRVIIPRRIMPNVVEEPVTVDVRSFGIRTPPCTREQPTYGILGIFHILPPALAWLWRLAAPRGFANPSIVGASGLSSEGVGSYWPFATGRRVAHANMLLEQIRRTPRTVFIIMPNQHVGAWRTGFMAQWLAREYLARRGSARFRDNQLLASRCPLLGRALFDLTVEGRSVGHWFLQTETQPEVGETAYDEGARQLAAFFQGEISKYLTDELDPLGRKIIDCCLASGTLDDYDALL